MLDNNGDVRRCSLFELELPVVGSFENEARSTQISKTKTPISKTKHLKLENEDP